MPRRKGLDDDHAADRTMRFLPLLRPRPPQPMADVDYPHPVCKNPIEDFVRIANERRHSHPRPLDDARRRFGVLGYIRNDLADASFDGAATVSPNARLSADTLRSGKNKCFKRHCERRSSRREAIQESVLWTLDCFRRKRRLAMTDSEAADFGLRLGAAQF